LSVAHRTLDAAVREVHGCACHTGSSTWSHAEQELHGM
jgi:hypothetical protein